MVLSSSVAYSRATAYVVSLYVSLCTHIFVYIRATQSICQLVLAGSDLVMKS